MYEILANGNFRAVLTAGVVLFFFLALFYLIKKGSDSIVEKMIQTLLTVVAMTVTFYFADNPG